jgi:hypothetical protein
VNPELVATILWIAFAGQVTASQLRDGDHPPDQPGGVTILRESSPGVLIVDNGGHQITFTIATATFGVEAA